jgi:hypothetical protein
MGVIPPVGVHSHGGLEVSAASGFAVLDGQRRVRLRDKGAGLHEKGESIQERIVGNESDKAHAPIIFFAPTTHK